ncbi:MAG: alpha/beta fold hydrolase, partial [Thermomicrobiaceae bacterium]|nr:alpha/beta fold hydrolase [Thermomicrobiaceae bacterium]
ARAFRTRVDDLVVYAEVAGEGPPVLLLHGLAGSTRWWSRNVAGLAARLRVYALDLAGFGRTTAARRRPLDELPEVLAAWMDQVGIERAHVVAHSMGGAVALRLAAEHPERVDRLVLVDAAGIPSSGGFVQFGRDLLREGLQTTLGLVPLLVSDVLRAGPASLLSASREILAEDVRPLLARVRAPTLLVWGERDALVPLEEARALAAQLPGARLVVIPGAGHNAMIDQPDAFNRAVLAFLLEESEGGGRAPSASEAA